jgi:sugar lactone lactonase YvrE
MRPYLLPCCVVLLLASVAVHAEPEPKWLPATAHLVPPETAPEGEGYFSIIEGKNGKLYVGTHANGVNAWLVEFDPASKKMRVAVDCHKAIGTDLEGSAAPRQDEPFVARPLTEEKSFTAGIEGPACDAAGNLYVVNLKRNGDIARVTPDGKTEVFVELPGKSVGNGIVFDRKGMMYVADYVGHNVLRIDPHTKTVEVFAHESSMNQPNDLAIAPDGTLYASDPNWGKSTGQLWKVGTDGKVTRVAAELGTTNGIEVSPDGKTLYVNESVQRNVWAFPIQADGTLGAKRLLKKFDDFGFDGMRCDVDGNLYVARYGKGTVVKLSPEGAVLREVDVLGKSPSNLCFGGPDGRTVYVTEVEHRRVVTFGTDRPGLAWQRGQKP